MTRQREWRWTERFAAQPEILAYLEHVADRFDLRRSYQFVTRVTSAVWSDDDKLWSCGRPCLLTGLDILDRVGIPTSEIASNGHGERDGHGSADGATAADALGANEPAGLADHRGS